MSADWASYEGYDPVGAARHSDASFRVSVGEADIAAKALSVVEDVLVVAVSPTAPVGASVPADEVVAIETPEESALVRLIDVTFDLEGTLLSFERVE